MKFEKTGIEGCFVIHIERLTDERGWFSRVFSETDFKNYTGAVNFVQINHSFNSLKGTFRGLHYQAPPFSDGKLVRCISGSIIDFLFDLRTKSPSFLKCFSVDLSAKNGKMIFLPKGLAHGFQTLEDNSELIYHHTDNYNKVGERGILYNDPLVNIKLPLPISVISEKDRGYPCLSADFKGIEV